MIYESHHYEGIALFLTLAMFAAVYRIARLIAARYRVHEGEAHFRMLAEAIPQIVWTADKNGKTNYINGRWQEVTGVDPSRSVGDGWLQTIHPDDRIPCLEKWAKCLRTGETFEDCRYRLLHGTKGYLWYLDRAVPMRDASGAIQQWFGTCTDIDDPDAYSAVTGGRSQASHRRSHGRERIRLQSEMRERALVQHELNQQS